MIFGSEDIIQLPTNYRQKVRYWLRSICAVSMETLALLQTAVNCE